MDGSTDLPLCDNEPIHIPGSIQPHGMLLVATRDRLVVTQAAGEIETRLGVADWHGAPLGALIGAALAERVQALAEAPEGDPVYIGRIAAPGGNYDASAHLAAFAELGETRRETNLVVVELEPAPVAEQEVPLLDAVERRARAFRRANNLTALYDAAARAFRLLTGFDRVLVYRFNSDDAGQVVAEDLAPGLPSLMDHYFPASDIPRQARALYVRNLSRVIPDIAYTPMPLRPTMPGVPVDMSDCCLRSVSPQHLQYMANMGMRASASFSLVRDGTLWGLIACHNLTPRGMSYDRRAAGRVLAGVLAREIRAKEDAEFYRLRLRLRSFEDDVLRVLAREDLPDAALRDHLGELRRALGADGVVMVRGAERMRDGSCPEDAAIDALVAWLGDGAEAVRATDRLPDIYPPAKEFVACGAGMLGIVLAADEPWAVLWFRAEQIETLRWAGNPHADKARGESGLLNPRSSFAAWVETVRGRSRRWNLAETEAAGRLREALLDARQARRMTELNRQLTDLLHDRTLLLRQKAFLVGEVNYRVQNSLELVSGFLAMQARTGDTAVKVALDEAGRRVAAVALVHRRLYRGERVDVIDAGRYVEELCTDTLAAMGTDWQAQLSLDLSPVRISTDRAVPVGLVLTELMINANKYAYGGNAGPLEVRLMEDRSRFQLSVADHGVGLMHGDEGAGFGSRLMRALVKQLGGELRFEDNRPGLRAVLTADLSGAET